MGARRHQPSGAHCPFGVRSTLHAEELLEDGHGSHEVGLLRHHLVDGLVGRRNLVEHAGIVPADDARRLALQIGNREDLFGLRAAHRAARAVRGRHEGLLGAESLDQIRGGAHAPRDDAELAPARMNGALASRP